MSLDGSSSDGAATIGGMPGRVEPGQPDQSDLRDQRGQQEPPDSASFSGPARVRAAAPGQLGRRQAATRAGLTQARSPGLGRDWIPWLTAGAVFAAYTPISVFRYMRREPTSWDLGIFTEYVKQYAHLHAPIVNIRGAGVDLLGDHFHPIVALIAPFFLLVPSSITLLVIQALLTAVSVLPVYKAGAELLGVGAGRAIAIAYGFSWGLQQMVNYDFHEIAFAVPLLAFSLSALVRGRMRAAVLWALPLVFVKEDQGFTLAAIGLIMVFAYRRQRLGFFLAGWGIFWSLLAILVIIPHLNASHMYGYWSEAGALNPAGGHFAAGGLWGRLTDGIATKLPTLALILLPTAFIALRSPLVLAALPSLALRFIGANSSYWGTQWHYNATVMPIVFIAAIDGVARLRARRLLLEPAVIPRHPDSEQMLSGKRLSGDRLSGDRLSGRFGRALEHYGAAAMLALCVALAFQFPLSSLWDPATYRVGPHVAAENTAMALVPNGASVATDLDLLAPLAARTNTYWLGNFGTNPATQYVVFDTESTDWQPPPANVLSFVESITHHASYRQIFLSNGVYVFRRTMPGQ